MRYLLMILAMAVALMGSGCLKNSAFSEIIAPSKETATAGPMAKISDFVTAYSENSIKADNDYAGKWVKVSGTVVGIDKIKWPDRNTYYVVSLVDPDGSSSVVLSCRFNFNKEKEIVALKRGDVVTVYGRIDDLGNIILTGQQLPTIIDSQFIK